MPQFHDGARQVQDRRLSDTPVPLGTAELRQIWPARNPASQFAAEDSSSAKWPQWKTWSVALGSSLLLWAMIISLLAALFA